MDWTPKYIKIQVDDRPKQRIDAHYWNGLWNRVIEQGDNNTQGINALKDAFEAYDTDLTETIGKACEEFLTNYGLKPGGVIEEAKKVNGHTVESDVPANAKFTDTTYSKATSDTLGLVTWDYTTEGTDVPRMSVNGYASPVIDREGLIHYKVIPEATSENKGALSAEHYKLLENFKEPTAISDETVTTLFNEVFER